MGFIITLVDLILTIFFLIIAIGAPLIDSQTCLPSHLYPKPLIDLKLWYADFYGDYLFKEKPSFFVGLVWAELLVQWPLSVLNLYGLLAKSRWLPTTCLIYGVSTFTSMVAILAELIGSGKASDKLLMLYTPFMGFAILVVLRGLLTNSGEAKVAGKGQASWKKRV